MTSAMSVDNNLAHDCRPVRVLFLHTFEIDQRNMMDINCDVILHVFTEVTDAFSLKLSCMR